MHTVIETIVPVFGIILLGFFLARQEGLHLPTLSNLAFNVTSPAFVFSLLSTSHFEARESLELVLGTLWVVVGTALCVWAYARRSWNERRGLLFPVTFWNAGNLCIPCAALAFGDSGGRAAALVFVTIVALQSSLGVWMASGRPAVGEVLRVPLFHGAVLGLLTAVTGFTLPQMIMEPIRMVGSMAIPLMLITLGIQLRNLQVSDLKRSLIACLLRLGCGCLFAFSYVSVFSVSGVNRQVILLGAVMPPAVISVIFAQKYQNSPQLVASTIVLATVVSLFSIPLMLAYLV